MYKKEHIKKIYKSSQSFELSYYTCQVVKLYLFKDSDSQRIANLIEQIN